jgi:hypothetical protein
MTSDPGACTEPELTEPVSLCRPDGRLAPEAVGWARQPIIDCALPGRWGRRKRWDFWSVVGPGFAMNLTYADVDYVGLGSVWFRDLEQGDEATADVIVPLARGFRLHPRAGEGEVELRRSKLRLRFSDDERGTTLAVSFPTKLGRFDAEVLVTRPEGHESLTVVIPWSDRRFQCTTKDVSRPAQGWITWGTRHWDLSADDGGSWGCLDFGRGRWRYRTTWNWGAGAGMVGGRRVGIQVGGRWTDGTGMTENALVVDGRLSKISEELTWSYDRDDWLAPWTVRTRRSDRVDLAFTPVHDKVSRLQAGVAESRVDQCFGTWSGRIVPDDGVAIDVADVFGWAEEATWRW